MGFIFRHPSLNNVLFGDWIQKRQGIIVKIIIKFILKNIYEKKLRTFLILFSIFLSSALFFASQAITDNVVDMFVADARQFYGSAEIMIYPDNHSPQRYIPNIKSDSFAPKAEYMVNVFQHSAYYTYDRKETISINLRGTTIEDMNAMCPFYTVGPSDLSSFTGRKVIISRKAAETYNLKTGENIKLEINNQKYRFAISAIAESDGFFAETGQTLNMVVPKSALSSIYSKKDITNAIFVKLKDGVNLKQSIAELENQYSRYTVDEPVPEEDVKENVASMSVGFMMMTVVVAFMSIFILYTSFKVVTLERLPMIGTFRSIGATRRTTDFVLLAESLLYGIIGGAAGCVMGLGILYLITMSITPSYMVGYDIQLVYSPTHMIAAFLMAIILSLVSSILPIIKISKIPVKEIVLNAIDKKEKSSKKRYITGGVLLVLYIILPLISPKELAVLLNTISMLSSVSGVILLLPLITEGFVLLFEKIYILLFGNIGSIAAKNLRQNKNILNNIALLCIAISSLMMITTVSDSVLTEVASFYTRNTTFDIYMAPNSSNRSFEQSLLSINGVKQICGNYTLYGIEIADRQEKITSIYGINTSKFSEYFDLDVEGDKESMFEELNHERSMIMSSALQEKLLVNKGDYLTLKLGKGEAPYKIIGFQNTMLDNGGNILVADKYFKADTGMQSYTEIYIKTEKDPNTVVDAIKKKYIRNQPFIITLDDMEKQNYEVNASIFNSMEAFAWLTLIIGIFGIINNYIISFIERKRSLAMYRSIGMSKKQIVKMMIAESMTGGLIGGIMGVTTGLMMVYTIPFVMRAIAFNMPVLLNPATILLSFILGVVVTLIASISPIVKSSKLNLIEALKYE